MLSSIDKPVVIEIVKNLSSFTTSRCRGKVVLYFFAKTTILIVISKVCFAMPLSSFITFCSFSVNADVEVDQKIEEYVVLWRLCCIVFLTHSFTQMTTVQLYNQ
jgi:hypothetical protein